MLLKYLNLDILYLFEDGIICWLSNYIKSIYTALNWLENCNGSLTLLITQSNIYRALLIKWPQLVTYKVGWVGQPSTSVGSFNHFTINQLHPTLSILWSPTVMGSFLLWCLQYHLAVDSLLATTADNSSFCSVLGICCDLDDLSKEMKNCPVCRRNMQTVESESICETTNSSDRQLIKLFC